MGGDQGRRGGASALARYFPASPSAAGLSANMSYDRYDRSDRGGERGGGGGGTGGREPPSGCSLMVRNISESTQGERPRRRAGASHTAAAGATATGTYSVEKAAAETGQPPAADERAAGAGGGHCRAAHSVRVSGAGS